MDKTTYEWVWRITSVRTVPNETVPMKRGDYLYVCIDDAGKARFHHRGQNSEKNTGLWNGASGEYCAKTNTVSGQLPNQHTFEMTLAKEEGYHRLTCKHRRNPDEGEWDADDIWS